MTKKDLKDNQSEKILVLTKGAPGSILGVSSHIMLNNHSVLSDEETYNGFLQKNEQMARNALRCLGFAYRELSALEIRKIKENTAGKFKLSTEEVEKSLIFLGLTGMVDPPRPEVSKAIELTQRAGIRVYIITGDHGLTAEAVAKQIGLIHEKTEHKIIFGEDLDNMPLPELKKLLNQKHLDVIFARVSPAHKLKIVSALKELGEIVAVTGDGVNDAPALKRADLGPGQHGKPGLGRPGTAV
jgi:magnesium-transporting ATPase (P-type)